ncbi:MAG: hypothetical protein RI909_107 [Bacteroidota bacterium]
MVACLKLICRSAFGIVSFNFMSLLLSLIRYIFICKKLTIINEKTYF